MDNDELTSDELLVLNQYRRIKDERHGDLDISVKDGRIVKLWRVDKVDLSAVEPKPLREVPRRPACS